MDTIDHDQHNLVHAGPVGNASNIYSSYVYGNETLRLLDNHNPDTDGPVYVYLASLVNANIAKNANWKLSNAKCKLSNAKCKNVEC